MKVISKQKRSCVFYDEEKDIFIKTFNPKFTNKIKYFFRLRKYPGENFAYIAKNLKELNINTLEILEYSNYSITTKNLHAVTLENYLKLKKENYSILTQYIDIVSTLLKNNIYCGDFAYDNFMVKDNKIFVIDLEDYKKVKFFKKSKKEAIKRLYKKTTPDIIEKIRIKLN